MARTPRSKRRTQGAELLGSFLEANRISFRAAGDALGVTGTTVWQWVHGQKVPTAARCQDITTWTNEAVPFEAWGVERMVVKPFQPDATGTDPHSG